MLDCDEELNLDTAKVSGNFAQIAQSVEQRTENPRVGGSIPPLGTKVIKGCSSAVERRSPKPNVVGSSPATPARAHSSVGRAPALQAGGHRFKPCCAHHLCDGQLKL
ncbi:hypothetical protein CULT_1840002 [[Clostridium] ultunense Esp]|uniref:Uncharacterized protein n=1 Tax=[Clostridium] ultunense Esp TaxID=1288971 RepID=M1Z980_9FIRM|nr:hypothetical protein CULT_1840002 [[Clostridium] ultunense Esp]SHD77714.1 conserved protein of unknown function [[Clostridium] ultunense Esp]